MAISEAWGSKEQYNLHAGALGESEPEYRARREKENYYAATTGQAKQATCEPDFLRAWRNRRSELQTVRARIDQKIEILGQFISIFEEV